MKGFHLLPKLFTHVRGPAFVVLGLSWIEPDDPLFQVHFRPGEAQDFLLSPPGMAGESNQRLTVIRKGFAKGQNSSCSKKPFRMLFSLSMGIRANRK